MLDIKVKYLTVGQWKLNVYFLISGNDVWIIDPGDEFDVIESFISENKYNVLGILLTHGHFDHISSAEKIKQKYGVKIYLHSKDKKIIRQANLFRKLAGGKDVQITPTIDNYLDNTQVIPFGLKEIKIFHTPGHSPGSVCFQLDNNLIVGDLFFYNKTGRTNLPGGSVEELNTSILFIIDHFKEFQIYPGHGKSFTLDDERVHKILNILNEHIN